MCTFKNCISVIIGTIHFVEKKMDEMLFHSENFPFSRHFFLWTRKCGLSFVWVSEICNQFMETLRLAKNTLAGVTLLEYPAGANLQRRASALPMSGYETQHTNPDAWTNSLVFNYKNHIKIHGWIIHLFCFILLGLEAKYEFWIQNCRKCSVVKRRRRVLNQTS